MTSNQQSFAENRHMQLLHSTCLTVSLLLRFWPHMPARALAAPSIGLLEQTVDVLALGGVAFTSSGWPLT